MFASWLYFHFFVSFQNIRKWKQWRCFCLFFTPALFFNVPVLPLKWYKKNGLPVMNPCICSSLLFSPLLSDQCTGLVVTLEVFLSLFSRPTPFCLLLHPLSPSLFFSFLPSCHFSSFLAQTASFLFILDGRNSPKCSYPIALHLIKKRNNFVLIVSCFFLQFVG